MGFTKISFVTKKVSISCESFFSKNFNRLLNISGLTNFKDKLTFFSLLLKGFVSVIIILITSKSSKAKITIICLNKYFIFIFWFLSCICNDSKTSFGIIFIKNDSLKIFSWVITK